MVSVGLSKEDQAETAPFLRSKRLPESSREAEVTLRRWVLESQTTAPEPLMRRRVPEE